MHSETIDAAQQPASSGTAASRRFTLLALAMLLLAAATILGALAFEHIGGYLPCALCLMQRTPYYVGVPLAALALAGASFKAPPWILVVLFGAFGALMLYNAGLGAYHSGVEWGFWEGPAACSQTTAAPASVDNLFTQLQTTHAPSCTEATWRFAGLSFAGWNVLVSALLAGLGVYAAQLAWRSR